jgi:hypothetical protein
MVRTKRAPLNLNRTPLILYTLSFAAFSLIDFDFCPDLFPLLPVLALSAGWLVWAIARIVGEFAERFVSAASAQLLQFVVVAVAVVLIIGVYLFDVREYTVRGVNFQDQMAVVETAKKYLNPGERVLTFGNAIVPVELHMQNAVKILHLGSKSGLGVLASEPGGLEGMLAALDRDPPKLITLSRENHPEWAQPFYVWLEQRYAPADVFPRANIRFFILKQATVGE